MSEPRDSQRLTQLDLFQVPPTIPDWKRLSPDVRRRTLILLARMLRSQSQAHVAVEHGREVGDE